MVNGLSVRGAETVCDKRPFVDGPLPGSTATAELVTTVTMSFIADPAAVHHHILINVNAGSIMVLQTQVIHASPFHSAMLQ